MLNNCGVNQVKYSNIGIEDKLSLYVDNTLLYFSNTASSLQAVL